VGGTDSGSCPKMSFGTSSVQPLGSITIQLLSTSSTCTAL
jgi:hypothetical protein